MQTSNLRIPDYPIPRVQLPICLEAHCRRTLAPRILQIQEPGIPEPRAPEPLSSAAFVALGAVGAV